MPFTYKPTKEETAAIKAGHAALNTVFGRNHASVSILEECRKRDLKEERRASAHGHTAASSLELTGRYCNWAMSGFKAPLARDMFGIRESARELAIAVAFYHHGESFSDEDRAVIALGAAAHNAAWSRGVKDL